jgi:hypothetical protein
MRADFRECSLDLHRAEPRAEDDVEGIGVETGIDPGQPARFVDRGSSDSSRREGRMKPEGLFEERGLIAHHE